MQTHTKRILSRKDISRFISILKKKKREGKKEKKTRETIVKLIAFLVNTKNFFLEKGYYRDLSQFPREKHEKEKKKKTRETIVKLIGFHANKKNIFLGKGYYQDLSQFWPNGPALMLLQNMNIQYIYKECIFLPEIRKTCQVSNIPTKLTKNFKTLT